MWIHRYAKNIVKPLPHKLRYANFTLKTFYICDRYGNAEIFSQKP